MDYFEQYPTAQEQRACGPFTPERAREINEGVEETFDRKDTMNSAHGEEWAAKLWKAYNKGCDHRAYKFTGEHVAGGTYQWERWSEDERIAYLRGYNGQFINSDRKKE